MAKFKVGDKVRRTVGFNYNPETGEYINEGDVRTVQQLEAEGWIYVDGFTGSSDPDYFELVESAPVQHVSSRSNDPRTSKAAGKIKRASLRQRVLDAITEAGAVGANGHEICGRGDDMLNSVTPRLAELRREGKIKDSGQRRDKQIVWVLA